MSGGKVTVSGTNYKIIGGKCNIGGTNYTIGRGKTTIGGTNYNIFLKKQTLADLFKSAVVRVRTGRNESTQGTGTAFTLSTAGTYYAFVFYFGYASIYKIVSTGSSMTKTTIKQTNSGYANLFLDNNYYYYSNNGTAKTSTYGFTCAVLRFPGYTVSQIDAILGAVTFTRLSARNGSTAQTLYAAKGNFYGKIAVVAVNTNASFVQYSSTGTATRLFVTSGSMNMLINRDNLIGYSIDTASTPDFTTTYGGSLLTMS